MSNKEVVGLEGVVKSDSSGIKWLGESVVKSDSSVEKGVYFVRGEDGWEKVQSKVTQVSNKECTDRFYSLFCSRGGLLRIVGRESHVG